MLYCVPMASQQATALEREGGREGGRGRGRERERGREGGREGRKREKREGEGEGGERGEGGRYTRCLFSLSRYIPTDVYIVGIQTRI